VGGGAVVKLANGSFVLGNGDWDHPGVAVDAGAATWCAADGTTVGPIHAGNSLVGTHAGDRVGGDTIGGQPGVVALASGHYVVVSSRWDAAVPDVGAVTWGRGDGTVTGAVSVANSLVGVRAEDFVATAVLPLSNGHYVVQSYLWDSPAIVNAGAATWADGNAPTVGTVTTANSLVGKHDHDRVGYLAAALSTGDYVVATPHWDAGAVRDAGAVTWRGGAGPSSGVVDETNSLVGSHADDTVGQFTTIGIPPLGVIPLPGGDYVVASPAWDDGDLANVGAATWASGGSATAGPLSPANSLVGALAEDRISQYIVTLDDGHYVVASPYWSARRGATTWGAGNGGVAGVVSAQNSLVGAQPGDFVSAYGVYALPGGAWVADNAEWSSSEPVVGAVTRAAAGLATSGEVTAQNSLVGSVAVDAIGSRGIVPLPDGGFLVESTLATGVGAVTRFAGGTAPRGPLPLARSLLGSAEDRIGSPGASVQSDGAIVMHTRVADADSHGAVTLFAADEPFAGSLYEPDTVRSSAAGGGPRLNPGYLPPSRMLVVGDPLGNRVVRLTVARLLHDGFEGE
jgi:hypothetical protein